MSSVDRRPDSPPKRRRSPPRQDFRQRPPTGPSGGIQIRGRANERDDRRDREDHRGDYYDDSYHRENRSQRSRSYERGRSRSRSRSRSRPKYDRRRYNDRDREGYQSPPPERSSRPSSPRRRERSPYYGGAPSREIILEGLAVDINEEDITKELQQYYKVGLLEDVRVIRERKTGGSRQFGFIRFPTVELAKAFMEHNYPNIYIYGRNADDANNNSAKVRIAFSRERSERERPGGDNDWTCAVCSVVNFSRRTDCFKCGVSKITASANPLIPAKPTHFSNTGDSDVSPDSTPSHFLIFRSLEPTVTEEILAKGAAKLLKPVGSEALSTEDSPAKGSSQKIASTSTVAHAGAKQGSIKRVLLVRDRKSDESWGFGFAEFTTVEEAQAAVAKFNALEKFTIASKPVLVNYIHAGVFVPLINPHRPAAQTYSFSATMNPSLKLIYWDEDAYVKEMVISNSEVIEAVQNEHSASSKSTQNAKAVKNNEPGKGKKRKADTSTSEGIAPKKAMASHLQFWTDRHAELHGIDGSDTSDVPTNNVGAASREEQELSLPRQSFADPAKHCCLLCARQFKSAAEVNKHERLSDLHKTNLKNEDAYTKGVARLKKAGLAVHSSFPVTETEYRDRAKERRAAFNQPKQPQAPSSAQPSSSSSSSAAAAAAAAAPPPLSQEVVVGSGGSGDDAPSSKGAALLGKMGWKSGSGLGATGSGSTAPIATDLYAAGVGLGAEGGKIGDAVEEASRSTRGEYSDFKEKMRERTKDRFERAA